MTRVQPLEQRFWSKVDRRGPDECWPWTGYRNAKGYGLLRLNGPLRGAHRISWLLAHGQLPARLFVCHACDNPPCVNPAHLWVGTNDDNIADREAKGRPSGPGRGEANRGAKLTDAQVLQIRASGERTIDLARRYGVSASTISLARLGGTWRHLPLAKVRP